LINIEQFVSNEENDGRYLAYCPHEV